MTTYEPAPDEGAGSTTDDDDETSVEAFDAAEVEELVEQDIESLLAERNQFKDIALRLQADFENYKKRVDRQAADTAERTSGRVAEELLPVLDACEAAFAHGVDGVEPIWSALLGALQRLGLEVMDPMQQPFDPTEQEAVLHEPGEGGESVVSDVLRTGYRWKGKVLRPAMVKVKG